MSVEFIADPAPQRGGETRTQQRQMNCGYIYRDIFCHKPSDSDQNYGLLPRSIPGNRRCLDINLYMLLTQPQGDVMGTHKYCWEFLAN